MTESVYERLQTQSLNIDKETLSLILSDYDKIAKRQTTLVEGRDKTKQMYPHLNDLITVLKERCKYST